MKISLVTGGAGFIGSRLAKRLVDRGDKVHILDDLSTGFTRNVPEDAALHQVDVSISDQLFGLKLPHKVDTVYHFAAQSSGEASFDDPLRDMDVNYRGTYNTLALAERLEADRYIFSSSMSVYGDVTGEEGVISETHDCDPTSYYGCNKLASEKLINIFTKHLSVIPTIFRFFNVYGPGQNMLNLKQGMVSIYLSYLMQDKQVVVKGSLDRFRDFIYIDDLMDAVIESEDSPSTYREIFNLGTGVKTTVLQLLKAILHAYGKEDFDSWVEVKGNTPGDIMGCAADMEKLKRALHWSPRHGIDEGIQLMKSWIDDTMEFWRD